MKKYKIKSMICSFVLVTFLLFLNVSCKKDKAECKDNNVALQPQNSFSCLINGVEYVPKGKTIWKAYEYLIYDKPTSSFGLNTINIEDFAHLVGVNLGITGQLTSVGTYKNITSINNDAVIYGDGGGISANAFAIDTSFAHEIVITKFDLENKNIAGNFEFTVVGVEEKDTLFIENGVFDVYNIVIQE